MANRIITKALAGVQDFLLGRQTVTQARYSGNVNIDGIYAGNIPHDLAAGDSIATKMGKKVEVVANIAALQALDTDATSFKEVYVYVLGYTTATDGGGGLFWLDASDASSAEDLKYIFNPDTLANGRWKRVDPDDQLTNDNGDANITLTAAAYRNQLFATNFTANRTVTLPTTGLYKGKTFRIIRTNSSAFTLTLANITPSVVLAASEAATTEVVWDGSAWKHTSKSVQIVNTAAFLAPYDPAKSYWAHEQAIPNMTVAIDAGRFMYSGQLILNAAQTTPVIVAPVTNPRIDLIVISIASGLVSVVTGAEAALPVRPLVPVNSLSIASLALPVAVTAITNSIITDLRLCGQEYRSIDVVGWQLASATYLSKSFSVAAQTALATGVAFSSDGLNMYVAGQGADAVFQYSLTVPWDVTTSSYTSKFLSVVAQTTQVVSLTFSADGTKMYIIALNFDTVYQYDLATAWEVNTGVVSANYNTSAFESIPHGVAFSSDGTSMYIIGTSADTVTQRTLSTPWNVGTAGATVNSFSVTTEDTGPYSVAFSADGKKMFILGTSSDTVYQYRLGTAWNVSTCAYESKTLYTGGQVASADDFAFSSDGSKLFLIGASDTVYAYATGYLV